MNTDPRVETTRSVFDPKNIEQYGLGGGCIPISYDEEGEIHVLLGRERFVSQWKGSCRWSSFEGSRKDSESLCEAAIREYVEETMGLLGDYESIHSLVSESRHWLRIVLKIISERRVERYHALYCIVVEYDALLPESFSKLRVGIEQIDRIQQEMSLATPPMLKHVGEIGVVTFDEDGIQITTEFSVLGTSAGWCCRRRGYVTSITNPEMQKRFLIWWDLRRRLEKSVKAITHACVHIQRGEKWKEIQMVTIVVDHLEKDQIRWWSLEELRNILKCRGAVGTTRFRPYFLPALQTLLEELTQRPPPKTKNIGGAAAGGPDSGDGSHGRRAADAVAADAPAAAPPGDVPARNLENFNEMRSSYDDSDDDDRLHRREGGVEGGQGGGHGGSGLLCQPCVSAAGEAGGAA